METKTHGRNQEDRSRMSRTPLAYRDRNHRSYYFLLIAVLLLSGCSALKTLGTVAAGAGGGALAGSMVSSGALVPAIGAATGGVIATGLNEIQKEPLEAVEITADTVVKKAPDNIFSVLQSATELLGWGLIGVFVIPLLLGWILPGPLAVKARKKKSTGPKKRKKK